MCSKPSISCLIRHLQEYFGWDEDIAAMAVMYRKDMCETLVKEYEVLEKKQTILSCVFERMLHYEN